MSPGAAVMVQWARGLLELAERDPELLERLVRVGNTLSEEQRLRIGFAIAGLGEALDDADAGRGRA